MKKVLQNTISKLFLVPVLLLVLGVGMFYFGQAVAGSGHTDTPHQAAGKKGKNHDDHSQKNKDSEHQSNDDSEHDLEEDEEEEIPVGHKKHGQEEHAKVEHKQDVGHETPKKGFFKGLVGTYADAFKSVQFKVDEIRRLDEENRRVKLENAWLRVQLESQKFSCRADQSKSISKTIGQKLQTETGAKTGRSLASIPYQFPENLLPEQLHALGLGYFKARDDEKAAKIFTFLTDMEDGSEFKVPQNFILAGISWYRLQNWKLAGEYFDRVVREKETAENKKYMVHAKLWLALVNQKQSNKKDSQEWIRKTIELHPHSVEAKWVNPQAEDHEPVKNKTPHKQANRKLASEKDGHVIKEEHGNEKDTKTHH